MSSSQRVETVANAISESSGMRFDGFWTRVEDLEPEDRDHAIKEATSVLGAADGFLLSKAAIDQAAKRIFQGMKDEPWEAANLDEEQRARAVALNAIQAAIAAA